jgi:HEAT repeat protein
MLAHRKALVAVLAGAGLCVAFLTVYLCRATLFELWYEEQLRSDDPEVRRGAAEALLGMSSVRSLAILLEYVEHPNPRDDPNAPIGEFDIRRFGRVVAARGSAVVPQLREALGSKSAKVRWNAARILSRMGPVAAGAAVELGAALRDPDEAVRTTAAHTLRRLGPGAKEALAALSGALSDPRLDDDIRWCTAEALGEIGPAAESAIPALEEATRAEDHDLRAAAFEALRRIREE